MRLTPGIRLGGYEIVALIGAGGMGVVYRARDTRLGRIVALKLTEEVSTDGRARSLLLREAQHASALNHPNICTIHEIGEANGTSFIVMEYVEGRPLNEMVPPDGLPVSTVVSVGTQIADAVAYAHEQGIIHRDLKPSNVVITPQGLVKILDFGLATRTWHEGASHASTIQVTQQGTIAGTIAYMAPEVLQGTPANAKSDIWSLGALLQELTTGAPPFAGSTGFELSSRILRDVPRPLPNQVPAGLSAVVARCLMKDPRERYDSARDVKAALAVGDSEIHPRAAVRRLAPHRMGLVAGLGTLAVLLAWFAFFSGEVGAVSSIAVAPFVNVGGDPETEYLSDGITESLINSLAQLPADQLKVIALNSVLRYKGRELDPSSMGRDLAVGAVVVGRVVHRSGTLSVSAELVNVRDQRRLWGATYNRKMADVLTIQEEIAASVSETLQLRIDGGGKEKLTKRYTANPDAYGLYLKGRYVWNKYTEAGWTQAIDYFRQALELDPSYALAWAGIADSYYQLSSLVLLPGAAIPLARTAALKALEIDDSLGEAHASLGIIKAQYDWDRAGAEKEFRRAIELSPNYATARQWFGMYHFANGQFVDALHEFSEARQLDPLSLIIAVMATWPLPYLERHDDALRQLQMAMEMFPDVPDLVSYFHDLRGEGYARRGMQDEAVADFLIGFRTQAMTGGGAEAVSALREAHQQSGMKGYWQKQQELGTAWYEKDVEAARQQRQARYVSPYRLAELHARLDQKDEAFALLERCYGDRDESLVWLHVESLKVDSPWQSIRADPRFTDLLRRLGFAA